MERRSPRPVAPGTRQAVKQGGRGIMAVALASRFWRPGCPKINHEVATRLALDQVHIEGEAQVAYMEFIDSETDAKWKVQLEQVLLAYCKMDTLAMVEMARFHAGHDA